MPPRNRSSSGATSPASDMTERSRLLSDEYFHPAPECESREGSIFSSVFILVSTVVGGGMLSLPYAFEKSGIALGWVFLQVCSLASVYTIYVLMSCSRRSGAHSFEDIASRTYGRKAQILTMVMLLMLVFLAFVAYLLLMRDLLTPLAQIFGALTMAEGVTEPTRYQKNMVMICGLVVISPVFFFKSMNALRHTSMTGVLAVLVLGAIITYRAVTQLEEAPVTPDHDVVWMTDKPLDAVYCFPFISLVYLCHFNVLPMHGELSRPTRVRIKQIVLTTISVTSVLYTFVAVCGYLYAFRLVGGVNQNILNNFPNDDPLVNLGRAALGLTVMLALPMLVMPTRLTLHRLIYTLTTSQSTGDYASIDGDDYDSDDEDGPRENVDMGGMEEGAGASYTDPKPKAQSKGPSRFPPSLIAAMSSQKLQHLHSIPPPVPDPSEARHVCLTLVIMALGLALALTLNGVAVIWSLMGSTVGFMIGYIMPSAFYLKVRASKPWYHRQKLMAYCVLVVSCTMCVLCTTQAIAEIVAPGKYI